MPPRCRFARAAIAARPRKAFMAGGAVGCHKTKCFVHPLRGVRAAWERPHKTVCFVHPGGRGARCQVGPPAGCGVRAPRFGVCARSQVGAVPPGSGARVARGLQSALGARRWRCPPWGCSAPGPLARAAPARASFGGAGRGLGCAPLGERRRGGLKVPAPCGVRGLGWFPALAWCPGGGKKSPFYRTI